MTMRRLQALGARPSHTLAAVLTALAAAVVAASSTISFATSDGHLSASATGALSQSGPRAAAVLNASGLAPGASRRGRVQVVNDGDAPLRYSIVAGGISDRPGPRGGRLSQRLRLTVEELGPRGRTRAVWSGVLSAMPSIDLGELDPGSGHSYRFTLSFPARGTGDDAFEQSATPVEFDWVAVAVG